MYYICTNTLKVLEEEKRFFEEFSGGAAFDFYPLPQSGSSRRNFIAKRAEDIFVVTHNRNLRENESFFYFSEVFSKLNLNTPKIYQISADRQTYIQQYLGAHTLSDIIEKEGLNERVHSLVKETLRKLHKFQMATRNQIDYSQTFEYERYDEIPILHDLNYFKFMFVDILELPYHKSTLLKEFRKLADRIQNTEPKSLMIRDFQARNIMADENNDVFFIDYQAAMEGPLMYDVISFLYQAKANFPDSFRNEMMDYYISFFEDEALKIQLKNSVLPIRLMRNIQVMGVYGFRGLVQKKEHFIKSIKPGIENLGKTAGSWSEMDDFPELNSLIKSLSKPENLKKIETLV